MKWLIAILGVGVVGYFVWRTKRAYTPDNVTQALTSELPPAPRPEPAPQVPSPTLCQAGVTIGGTAVATYYGAPPQLSAPLAAGLSKPVCDMGSKVTKAVIPVVRNASNIVGASIKSTAYDVPKAGIYAGVDATKTLLSKSVRVASTITSPKAFVGANIDLAKATVTAPVKAATTVLKKADPRSWF